VIPLLAACGRPASSPPANPTVAPGATPAAVGASSTLSGSTPAPPAGAASPVASAVPSAASAAPTPTPAAQALQSTVSAYVADWQGGKYADMYQLLSTPARASITQDKFVARYTNISTGIEQQSVTVQPTIPSDQTPTGDPPTVNVPFHVSYKLATLGNVDEDNVLPLTLENGTWKVAWTPGLIFKDLTATRTVSYDAVPATRGSILDRNGNLLAVDGSILIVGVVPGEIKDEAAMLKALSDFVQIPQDQIKQKYANAKPDWFVPIKDLPMSQKANVQQKLGSVAGVSTQEKTARVYPFGADTAHVVGYVSAMTDADLKNQGNQGYQLGDLIGRSGVEAWGEQYLRGQAGATLAILEADGSVVRTIAQKQAVPGNNVITTLDVNYQIQANKILGDHSGSLVVLDPRDNSVLALSSEPSFDPNLFILGMSDQQWQQMNGPTKPLMDRATEGLYPTGSIFKPITMAAALENGLTRPSETFNCGLNWNGLPGVTLHNWKAEGTLNLIQSLTGSCDPTFYTLGLRLNQKDPNILPTFARKFGLGQSTGIVGINDAPGLVPDPAWKQKNVGQPWYDVDGVYLAIGQGYLLATSLQMANVYSTLANHGTVRNPVLVSEIKKPDGTVVKQFKADTRGTIPASPTTLGYIYQGMSQVTNTPLGTAYYAWQGSKVPMEAKTGSAENANPKAHAWFAGYTPPENASLLTIVMLEGGELGGEFAAPLGRQMVEYALQHPAKPISG
jgi:penicillin-binding protein 2